MCAMHSYAVQNPREPSFDRGPPWSTSIIPWMDGAFISRRPAVMGNWEPVKRSARGSFWFAAVDFPTPDAERPEMGTLGLRSSGMN